MKSDANLELLIHTDAGKKGVVDVQVHSQQIHAGTVGVDAFCCALKHYDTILLISKSADDEGTEEQT